MMRFAHITGWGMAVPEKVLTNQELAAIVDNHDGSPSIPGSTSGESQRMARQPQLWRPKPHCGHWMWPTWPPPMSI
jgi:3-oxoacyl-[acyl-carrier-protein] synthase III